MPAKSPLDAADGALGQLVERLTISHHRRRLARVRWTAAIDPPPGGWAAGEPPPRPGNAVTVLVDGAEAFRAIVVDDQVAFVGGIDLTNFNGDRWDTPQHQARGEVGWHDVAARITGPAVQEVAHNFAMRWEATTGEKLPADSTPSATGDVELQLVRTVPDGMYRQLPRGEFRILESYLRGLRAAQRFVYLENQFLCSPEILAELSAKLARPPTPEFGLVLVLPAKPDNGGDATPGQPRAPVLAGGEGGRVLGCPALAIGGRAGGARLRPHHACARHHGRATD